MSVLEPVRGLIGTVIVIQLWLLNFGLRVSAGTLKAYRQTIATRASRSGACEFSKIPY